MTTAKWIREFVSNHPDYKQDSVVNTSINYDLMKRCSAITNGEDCPELLPTYSTRTRGGIPEAMRMAENHLDSMAEKHTLLQNGSR